MPTVLGATNWSPPPSARRPGLFYVSVVGEHRHDRSPAADAARARRGRHRRHADGTGDAHAEPEERRGRLRRDSRARSPHAGEKWEFKMNDITWAGVLTTASDLLFSGGKEGYFFALDARNGELLWKMRARRADQQRPDELLGQRQAVRDDRRGQRAVRVCAAAMTTKVIHEIASTPEMTDRHENTKHENIFFEDVRALCLCG